MNDPVDKDVSLILDEHTTPPILPKIVTVLDIQTGGAYRLYDHAIYAGRKVVFEFFDGVLTVRQRKKLSWIYDRVEISEGGPGTTLHILDGTVHAGSNFGKMYEIREVGYCAWKIPPQWKFQLDTIRTSGYATLVMPDQRQNVTDTHLLVRSSGDSSVIFRDPYKLEELSIIASDVASVAGGLNSKVSEIRRMRINASGKAKISNFMCMDSITCKAWNNSHIQLYVTPDTIREVLELGEGVDKVELLNNPAQYVNWVFKY